ncbi:unnamed protein product [Rangifer tarandus platyrhynchus]|uniref:Uncharacterized protein n=1 Tax=Rangifer tarandus platyrhynchus TaxID=3082113 RepID=A0AC59YIP0_RANTA
MSGVSRGWGGGGRREGPRRSVLPPEYPYAAPRGREAQSPRRGGGERPRGREPAGRRAGGRTGGAGVGGPGPADWSTAGETLPHAAGSDWPSAAAIAVSPASPRPLRDAPARRPALPPFGLLLLLLL